MSEPRHGEDEASLAERRRVVLVVDDEPDIRESLRDLLESSIPNAECEVADSGAAALEILRRRPVDVVLTDYRMPGMSGLEFLREAKKVAPGVPRLLMTAYPDLDLAIAAVNEARIESFFTKPFEPAQIVDVVGVVLRERRASEMRSRSFARSLDALRRELRTRR